MTHPLDGAIARVNRANFHIQELKRLLERLREVNEDVILSEHESTIHQTSQSVATKTFSSNQGMQIITDVPIVVGEIIYNLRAALDYIVYELSREDSGAYQDGTQFIIEDIRSDPKNKQRGFEPRAKRYLCGLNSRHIDAIEMLQPYKGVDWTKSLRDVSNPDKHRKLVPVEGNIGWTLYVQGKDTSSHDAYFEHTFLNAGMGGEDVHIHLQSEIDILLPDGLPLLETLQILQRKVAETINSFKPEFK